MFFITSRYWPSSSTYIYVCVCVCAVKFTFEMLTVQDCIHFRITNGCSCESVKVLETENISTWGALEPPIIRYMSYCSLEIERQQRHLREATEVSPVETPPPPPGNSEKYDPESQCKGESLVTPGSKGSHDSRVTVTCTAPVTQAPPLRQRSRPDRHP